MTSRYTKVVGLAALLLMVGAALAVGRAAPVAADQSTTTNSLGTKYTCTVAECDIPEPGTQPVWANIDAVASGNYPGGDEMFNIFVVASAQNASESVVIQNMTLSAPFFTNYGIGFPTLLYPGQALVATISLPIPANYTQSTFTANLVVDVGVWNGTAYVPDTLTGNAPVTVIPLTSSSGTHTSSQSTSSSSGTVSTSLAILGIAVPTIVAVLAIALLVQARAKPKPPAT